MKTKERILQYVEEFTKQNGYCPTVREIGKAVGLSSSSTVHRHLKNLEEEGLIDSKTSTPRTWRVNSYVSVLQENNKVATLIEWDGRKYKLVE